ncbi:hypothetical protein HPP92_001594 [Vanilla planifolia]|uniref:Dof zinc finger protein n=1 Tax=Vanilla planifolia TaxID=51239 RepID=A0A835RU95_VANPL|nr:hypothetical protein HPP92_001594 [Vanilla planifolia]
MVAKVEDSTTSPDAAGAAIAAALKCPRCDSTNTKFCYYNNYSLAQPRHFCKACKRYWTRGGTLRNVPVGGGCRKNKRHKKPQPSSSSDAAPRKQPPSRNSLPPPPPTIHTTDITPLLYGLPPLQPQPATSTPNLFFPRFDLDSHLAAYEDSFPSSLGGAHLADLQPSTTRWLSSETTQC